MEIVRVANLGESMLKKLKMAKKVVQLKGTTQAVPTLIVDLKKRKGNLNPKMNRKKTKIRPQMTLPAKGQINRGPIHPKIKDPTTPHMKQIQERTLKAFNSKEPLQEVPETASKAIRGNTFQTQKEGVKRGLKAIMVKNRVKQRNLIRTQAAMTWCAPEAYLSRKISLQLADTCW